jgi:transcriptional regulator with XRE-family HTH domain
MLRLSQTQLADALDLTFQQVQKYERGANRIGASRLLELARILDVPVTFFFDDEDPVRAPAVPIDADAEQEALDLDPLRAPETRELVAAFYGIPEPLVRRRLLDLAKALAPPSGDNAIGVRSKFSAALETPSRGSHRSGGLRFDRAQPEPGRGKKPTI